MIVKLPRERGLPVVFCCVISHDAGGERGGRREVSWHCADTVETLE